MYSFVVSSANLCVGLELEMYLLQFLQLFFFFFKTKSDHQS